MQSMWSFYGMLTLVFLSVVFGYGALIVLLPRNPNKASEASIVRLALKNIGVEQPAWHTMAVSASQDVSLPLDAIWETWADLEGWQGWSTRHRSTRWVSTVETGEEEASPWQVGARFEQTQWLGIPFGKKVSVETISEVIPARKVRWCQSSNGTKSCHVWSFTLLPNRKVRVTNTQVFHGTSIGLLKPILFVQWQRQFEKSLNNLVEQTRAKM